MHGPIRTAIYGIAMGCADAVPGVSGGTIALILGFYERLLASLYQVIRALKAPWDPECRSGALRGLGFLLPLGLGAVTALYIATKLLVGDSGIPDDLLLVENQQQLQQHLVEQPPKGLLLHPASAPIVFGFFFGLVALSVSVPWRERRSDSRWDAVLVGLGILVAAVISLSPPIGGTDAAWALLGAGMVAISVMLLPGISGSLALLVLGMYQPISAAVHEGQPMVLVWFGLGVVAGLILVVPLLRQLLLRAHDRTMAVLTGLMAGSLAALWPWKAHYLPKLIANLGPMHPQLPSGAWWWPILAMLIGGAVIVLVQKKAPATDH